MKRIILNLDLTRQELCTAHVSRLSLFCAGLVTLMLSLPGFGCAPDTKSPKSLTKESLFSPRPLTVALTAHQGNDRLDVEIRRMQDQVRTGHATEPALERLGWLFVKKARESFDTGFYKVAEQCSLALEETNPQSHEALLLRGHVLHSLHRFKQAEPLARELISKRGLPFDFGLLSDVLMEQGKLEEAIGACQKMVNLRPDLHSYARGAHVRWLKGDVGGAQKLMGMAASATSPRDPESAAWVYTRLAGYDFQLGAMAAADGNCAVALEFQSDYPPALLLKGRMLLAQGNNGAAADVLRRASALNPLPEYQWALAEALRVDSRGAEAASVETQLRQKGAAADPRTYSLYLATRQESVQMALRLAQAEMDCRADVFTHDALGWALAAAGNLEDARRESAAALSEGTKDARLFLHAAVIAAKTGDHDAARRWAQQAGDLQHMLLPSERGQLRNSPLADPVVARSGN